MSSYKRGRPIIRVRWHRDPGLHRTGKDRTRKIEERARYICFRSREGYHSQEIGAFGKDTDNADIMKFVHKIKEDHALQHPNTVKCHEMIISFPEKYFFKFGVDFKEMVREIMKELEERKGMELDWIASEHLAKGHPHVHVLIKSTGKTVDGDTKRLKLSIPKRTSKNQQINDMTWMKDRIDQMTGRELHERIETSLRDAGKGFVKLLDQMIQPPRHTEKDWENKKLIFRAIRKEELEKEKRREEKGFDR